MFGRFKIEEGFAGIVTRLGKVNRIVNAGTHGKIPFVENVIRVDLRPRNTKTIFTAQTKDRETVKVEVEIDYAAALSDDAYIKIAFDGVSDTDRAHFFNKVAEKLSQGMIEQRTMQDAVNNADVLTGKLKSEAGVPFEDLGFKILDLKLNVTA